MTNSELNIEACSLESLDDCADYANMIMAMDYPDEARFILCIHTPEDKHSWNVYDRDWELLGWIVYATKRNEFGGLLRWIPLPKE